MGKYIVLLEQVEQRLPCKGGWYLTLSSMFHQVEYFILVNIKDFLDVWRRKSGLSTVPSGWGQCTMLNEFY